MSVPQNQLAALLNLSQPAQRTPLSQQAHSLQPFMLSLDGGLATYPADIFRPPNQARVLNNVLQSRQRGVYTNRDAGWIRQRPAAIGTNILEFGKFIDARGKQTLLLQSDDTLYSYDLATSLETAILSGFAVKTPCFRNFGVITAGASPNVVMTNGDSPMAINITSVTAAAPFGLNGNVNPLFFGQTAGPLPVKTYSKPTICEVFSNRMVYAGFDGVNHPDTANDVLICNFGSFNTVTQSGPITATDGGIISVPPVLGSIRCLKSLRLTNQQIQEVLVIGCTDGVAVVTGHDATSFNMVVLTDEFGIPSNRAILQIMNDLLFLADDGIRQFSSLLVNASLLTATLTYDLQDVINAMDQDTLQNAFVVHHRSTKDIQFWFPTAGNPQGLGVCSNALVCNYSASNVTAGSNGQAAYNFVPVWSTRDSTNVQCGIDIKDPTESGARVFLGGGYDGVLQKHYRGNLFDGEPVPFDIIFALASTGDPATGSSIRKMIFQCPGDGEKFLAQSAFYETQGDHAGTTKKQLAEQDPFLINTTEQSETILGQWVMGNSAFPSNHTHLIDYEPTGEGRYVELEAFGNDASHFIDIAGVEVILSGGGTRR